MSGFFKKSFSAAFTLMSVSAFHTVLHADEEHGFTQRGAHVHGVTELAIVGETGEYLLEIESPGMDIVGFEVNQPNAAQREAIDRAIRLLEIPENVLTVSPSGNNCHVTDTDVHLHGADIDGHEHDHGGGHGHGHAHEHHHESGGEHQHMEFHARYVIQCSSGGTISELTLQLFEHFPSIETVNAAWFTDQGQGAARLSERNPTLRP